MKLGPGALVLLDSSAILATMDAAEAQHAVALRTATELVRLRCRAFQTILLRAETHALLIVRLGMDAARRWLAAPPPLVEIEPADEARGRSIVQRYRDKDFSLCDAVSFAVIERLRVDAVFTFDRHFRQYGCATVP